MALSLGCSEVTRLSPEAPALFLGFQPVVLTLGGITPTPPGGWAELHLNAPYRDCCCSAWSSGPLPEAVAAPALSVCLSSPFWATLLNLAAVCHFTPPWSHPWASFPRPCPPVLWLHLCAPCSGLLAAQGATVSRSALPSGCMALTTWFSPLCVRHLRRSTTPAS